MSHKLVLKVVAWFFSRPFFVLKITLKTDKWNSKSYISQPCTQMHVPSACMKSKSGSSERKANEVSHTKTVTKNKHHQNVKTSSHQKIALYDSVKQA